MTACTESPLSTIKALNTTMINLSKTTRVETRNAAQTAARTMSARLRPMLARDPYIHSCRAAANSVDEDMIVSTNVALDVSTLVVIVCGSSDAGREMVFSIPTYNLIFIMLGVLYVSILAIVQWRGINLHSREYPGLTRYNHKVQLPRFITWDSKNIRNSKSLLTSLILIFF